MPQVVRPGRRQIQIECDHANASLSRCARGLGWETISIRAVRSRAHHRSPTAHPISRSSGVAAPVRQALPGVRDDVPDDLPYDLCPVQLGRRGLGKRAHQQGRSCARGHLRRQVRPRTGRQTVGHAQHQVPAVRRELVAVLVLPGFAMGARSGQVDIPYLAMGVVGLSPSPAEWVPRALPARSPSTSRFARVGEAEAEVAGCAFGQGGGEYAGVDVVVVVHFGGGLAGVGAQDSADVLDQASFERDR